MSGTLKTNFTDIRLIQPKGADTPYFLVGSYTLTDGSKKECHPFPLDMVLGVGLQDIFAWGLKGFSKRATGVHLDGTTLVADLKRDGSDVPEHGIIDLNERFTMGEHPNGQGEKVLIALDVMVLFFITDKETAAAFLAEPEIQKISALKDGLLEMWPNGTTEELKAPAVPDTHDYGGVELDAFPTAFRIEKAAGQEVKINPYDISKASAGFAAENSAGQSLPKFYPLMATANLIEGEGDASAGMLIDSIINIEGTSLDLKSLGTGTGTKGGSVTATHIRSGPVMMNGPGFWEGVGNFFIRGGLNMARADMKGAKNISNVVKVFTGKDLPGMGQDNALYRPEFNK